MNQSFNSNPGFDPQARAAADAKHQALASGRLKLPNLLLRSAMSVFLLYALLTLVLITTVEFGYLDAQFALIAGVVFAALQFIAGPWLMDLSLRWVYTMSWIGPHELPDHLRAFVERVCGEQKMKFPSFGIIDDSAPQAFTYGHHPSNARVVLSRGTFELLTPAELEGVVAHEIGHARNWDMALMTIVNLVPLLLYYLYRALTRWGGKRDKGVPWYVTFGAYLLYIVSEYVVLWFSRTREFYADRFAGRVTGNPNALATALIKIAYGLAAQDSSTVARKASRFGGQDEMTTLDLSDRKKWSSEEPPKEKKRDFAGEGALAALNIFDRKAAVSMVVASASQFTTGASSGLDAERVKSAMQWDIWNPWAKWYELHSTHPLVARRLEYLADQAASLGQRPFVVFDRAKPESYWDEFLIDLLVMALPIVALVGGLALVLSLRASTGEWHTYYAGLALAVFGAGTLLKTLFRYRGGEFRQATVADLLSEVKVSPVRPVPTTLTGRVIGKGVPGLIYSEDFVLRDETGIMFLDYQQPLAIWNFLFGLLKAGGYQGDEVRVTGWFRRAPVPYVEIFKLEVLSGTGESRTCYSYYASLAWGALLLAGGLALAFLL